MSQSTDRQDIIIPIHPKHVANIVSRIKNHEFRNYLLPPSTQRLWIYETSPLSSIRYVATISHGKRPGEIHNPHGLRNDEFDRGDLEGRVKYAYEILKLEKLQISYSLTDLKTNGWLNGAPQKYCFLKPSMREAASALALELVFTSEILASSYNKEPAKATTPTADVPKPQLQMETRKIQMETQPMDRISKPKGKQVSLKKQNKKQASLQHWVKRQSSTGLDTK